MAAPKAGHTTALEMRCMTEPNSLNAGAFHTRCQPSTGGAGAFHPIDFELLFCGCRPECKSFLDFMCCDRVRSSVRPQGAAGLAPRAGMVICGSGPELVDGLFRSERFAGFPDPDLFDHFAHSGRRLPTPLSPATTGARFSYVAKAVSGSR